MRILLINPPYHSVTSLYGVGEQLPLGLLSLGGPLLDDGHEVTLLDAEVLHLSVEDAAARAAATAPDLIMAGHSGSTPAHPVVMEMARALKARLPMTKIVYGGVYPTYHGEEILAQEPSVDIIVRGEGETTVRALTQALASLNDLSGVRGIVYRDGQGAVRKMVDAEMIRDLDSCRVGWELIDNWDRYQCWGRGRSAVVQLSRGCPHQCTYCGQRGFWTKWRYRTPEKVAAEIAWLHREKGVKFVDLADENPTSSRRIFERFLKAMIAENVPVSLFASIRAGDIVRDADILPLYRQAGIECVLMGMETTDPETLRKIRKGATTRDDQQAIRLLRRNNILSMVGHIVGFEQERFSDYWRALRQLLHYDPDLLNAMYVTPHAWTRFYRDEIDRTVVQEDRSKWDYRHQILGARHLQPWQILALVKLTEFIVQTRPQAIARLIGYPDQAQRRAYRWCVRNASGVWLDEVHDFLFRSNRVLRPSALWKFWGAPVMRETPLALRGG